MQKPPLDPDVADMAPTDPMLTSYDNEHIITYFRILDADAVGADWREVAVIVLHIDPEREPDRARRAFDSHLARAKWMTDTATGICCEAVRTRIDRRAVAVHALATSSSREGHGVSGGAQRQNNSPTPRPVKRAPA